MISKDSLTIEWIDKASKANRKADKILIEKVIRSLLLVEGLAESALPFVFKGGTALMLLLNSSKRLSIDVDIVLPQDTNEEELNKIFSSFAKKQGFNKVELQHRSTESKIVKSHYKFFYTPIHRTSAAEESIIL